MKKILKEILAIVLSLVLLVTLLNVAAGFLIPFRSSGGCTWEQYAQEPANSIDVLFFGSSVVYCDLIPGEIYAQSGIRSYLMTGPEQTIPITYYYIKEALETQRPQAIALELSGMFFHEYETHTTENITYMPWGKNRLEATFAAAEKERRLNMLMPFLEYHDLWRSTGLTAIKAHLNPGTDIYAGYVYLADANPQIEQTVAEVRTGYAAYWTARQYLRMIAEYCQEKDVKLILYLAPTMRSIPEEDMEILSRDIASIPYTDFVDYNDLTDELMLDQERDWFDRLHFNFTGAVKFSGAMTQLLLKNGVAPAHAGDETLWKQRVSALEELKE